MFIIGDTHGNIGYLRMVIKNKDLRDTHLIHVGDYGVGFIGVQQEMKNIETMNIFLAERNLVLHVFRGNHDNPNYFRGDVILDNIKFHEDYTVLEIEGKRILGVGGALSIDRVPRRRHNVAEVAVNHHSEKQYYWIDEEFVLDVEKLEAMRFIDIVVTHTAPHFCYPINKDDNWPPIVKDFMDNDPTLANDLNNERQQLTEMDTILKKNNDYKEWYYGHFHQNEYTMVDGKLFKCLGVNQFYEVKDYYGYEEELNEKYGE